MGASLAGLWWPLMDLLGHQLNLCFHPPADRSSTRDPAAAGFTLSSCLSCSSQGPRGTPHGNPFLIPAKQRVSMLESSRELVSNSLLCRMCPAVR